MVNNQTHYPEYKINYVRVYQNPNDEKQKVGCSTPERPTKKYIEANEHLYKTPRDVSDTFRLQILFEVDNDLIFSQYLYRMS